MNRKWANSQSHADTSHGHKSDIDIIRKTLKVRDRGNPPIDLTLIAIFHGHRDKAKGDSSNHPSEYDRPFGLHTLDQKGRLKKTHMRSLVWWF